MGLRLTRLDRELPTVNKHDYSRLCGPWYRHRGVPAKWYRRRQSKRRRMGLRGLALPLGILLAFLLGIGVAFAPGYVKDVIERYNATRSGSVGIKVEARSLRVAATTDTPGTVKIPVQNRSRYKATLSVYPEENLELIEPPILQLGPWESIDLQVEVRPTSGAVRGSFVLRLLPEVEQDKEAKAHVGLGLEAPIILWFTAN